MFSFFTSVPLFVIINPNCKTEQRFVSRACQSAPFVLSLNIKSLLKFKSDPLDFSVNKNVDLLHRVYTKLNLLLVATMGAKLHFN